MPGKKYDSIKNPKQYEALKRQGYSKTTAAKISNAAKRRLLRSNSGSNYK